MRKKGPKRSLNIPNGQLEDVNRRTCNTCTMAQEQKAKLNNNLQNATQSTKHWVTRTPLKSGCTKVSRKGTQFLLTSESRRATLMIISSNKPILRTGPDIVMTTNRIYQWSCVACYSFQIFTCNIRCYKDDFLENYLLSY